MRTKSILLAMILIGAWSPTSSLAQVCDETCCDGNCYTAWNACVNQCPNCYPGDLVCEYYYQACRNRCDQDLDACIAYCHGAHIDSTTVISPPSGQFLRGTLPVTVRIVDDRAVTYLEFYVDETRVGTVSNPPACTGTCDVTYNWDTTTTADGTHGIWARAFNGTWGSPSARVSVSVDNSIPTVQITQPPNDAFFIDPVTVDTQTGVGPSGINRVEFYVDDVLFDTKTSPPYRTTWQDTTCVAHPQDCRRNLKAKIYNGLGVSGTSSVVLATDANAVIRGADEYMKQEGNFSGALDPAGSLNYNSATDLFIGTATAFIPRAITMYERVLRAFPSHATTLNVVKRHLVTALTRLAEGYVLAGNQRFVDALTGPGGSYTTLDISNAITQLEQARQGFDNSLGAYFSRFLTTLPAPHNDYWTLVSSFQPSHCDNYDSHYLDSPEERYFPTCITDRTPYWDWRLMGKAAGRKAFATRELAKDHWALNTTSEVDQAANLLAIGEMEALGELTFLETAITPTMAVPLREKIFNSWRDLSTEADEITRAVRYMAEGRNFLGLKRQTVQLIRIDTDTLSNFELHRNRASMARSAAVSSLAQLRQVARQFETSASNYLTAQRSNETHYDDILSDLCGPAFEQRCDSGRIRRQLSNIDIAKNKVEQVQQEIDNAEVRYQNALQQQFDEQRIRRATIDYVMEGVDQEEQLIDSEVQLRKEAEEERGWFSAITGIIQGAVGIVLAPESGGISLTLAAHAFASSASSLSSGISSFFGGSSSRAERQGYIDKQRVRLQALERARIMEEGIELADLQYRTFILNTRLDRQKLDIDLKGATLAYDQEVQLLADLFDQLNRAFTERENWRLLNQVGSNNVFRDPTLRMFRDAALDGYSRDQRNALWAAYNAGLALIYELNKYAPNDVIQWQPSDCGGCQPEIRNPDDLLRMLTPDRLQAAIDTLGYIWDNFRALVEHHQIIQTKLTWILGFRDPAIAPAQLRQYLNDHKIDNANVFLTFPTNIAVSLRHEDDPLFAQTLAPFWANLKIEAIQAFIQGGNDWSVIGDPFSLFLYYGFRADTGDPTPVIGYMRRPDADIRYGSPGSDQISYYLYDSVGPATIQSGTGSPDHINWQLIPQNAKFLGRALGLDTWGMHICIDDGRCPGNSTLIPSFDQIEEIHLRFICEGITLPQF